MRPCKRKLLISKFLPVALIGVIYFGVLVTDVRAIDIIEQGAPAPYGGLIFDDESSGKLLLDVQKIAIMEETVKNLEAQVETLKASGANYGQQIINLEQTAANLKKMVELCKQLLETEEQRSALYKERSEFYIEQGQTKDQLLDQQQKMIEELTIEAKKKSFWQPLAIGEFFTIIGLALALAL